MMMKAMLSQPMAGKTDGEIAETRERAKALPGRSPAAIADKASEMGLAWKRQRDKWTPEEDALLLRHIMEVSQETGRAPSSVASRVAGLRRSAKRADAERMVTR